jgi:aminoglycoside/choline kinase family phosphotransferase
VSLDFAPLAELVARVAPAATASALALNPAAMVGGASSRRYFRFEHDGKRYVAMYVPDGNTPEEIQRLDPRPTAARWPFLEVRDLLAERGVTVPELFAEDTTLANFLLRLPAEKPGIYTQVVTDLARAQRTLADLPSGSVISMRAFDADLLRWEIDHFREWGLEARGVHLNEADRALFDGIAERLATRIASWPRGFVHRDYQSRNLMVVTGADGARRIVWIDFQDALLGPRVYDLVALLNDSYQEFDRAFLEARLDEFAAVHGYDAQERTTLGREFDLVTVQRKLKDAGRFVFIDKVKGNPSFLQFVEPTLDKARAAMDRLAASEPDMRALAELVDRVRPR